MGKRACKPIESGEQQGWVAHCTAAACLWPRKQLFFHAAAAAAAATQLSLHSPHRPKQSRGLGGTGGHLGVARELYRAKEARQTDT